MDDDDNLEEDQKKLNVPVILLSILLLGAAVWIIVLYATDSVHWNGQNGSAAKDSGQISPSNQSLSSNSRSAVNPGPALSAKDLTVQSFGASETPFEVGSFLRPKFPLLKVEPNKTYGMLCRCVITGSDGKQYESFGLSVVHVVLKPGSSTQIQMRTVVEGCVDSTQGQAVSKLRLNRDPLKETVTSESYQFDVESLASDRRSEDGIQATVPSIATAVVVYPQFCLLKSGQTVRTVTMKKLDNEKDGAVALTFGKLRTPQPFPIFFAAPSASQNAASGSAGGAGVYVQSVEQGKDGSSWFLPVGMTCIPANLLYNAGYMTLYFMNDTQNTLIGAIGTGGVMDRSGKFSAQTTRYLINPMSGNLGLTFGNVTVP